MINPFKVTEIVYITSPILITYWMSKVYKSVLRTGFFFSKIQTWNLQLSLNPRGLAIASSRSILIATRTKVEPYVTAAWRKPRNMWKLYEYNMFIQMLYYMLPNFVICINLRSVRCYECKLILSSSTYSLKLGTMGKWVFY